MKEKTDQYNEQEAMLAKVRQAKDREREQLEAQLAQQKEESRRTQDKLQAENSVRE